MSRKPAITVGPIAADGPDAERELAQYARALSLAFIGRAPDAYREWVTKGAGLANTRVARDERGDIMGGLILVPMGQWFGGRSVPMTGVAGVAVAPEARGQGAALALMRASVREIHTSGVPLSTLYPALQELYRLVGYEQAGSRFETTVPTRLINVRGRVPGYRIRALRPDDEPAVRALHASLARRHDGHLDRGEYVWARVKDFRGTKAEGLAVENDRGALEGYVYFSQKSLDHPVLRHAMNLHDLAAATPRAGSHLLGFFAAHRSMTETVGWHGPHTGAMHALLPEQVYTVRLHEHWMTRVVDAPAAFAARGYPAGVSAALTLDIADDLIPENAGRWRLRIADGKGSLRRATPESARDPDHGAGPNPGASVTVSARGLAPLFTGFQSPRTLRLAGMLEGPDEAMDLLESALRPSPAGPSMIDFF